ncbi:MAG: hypothetical protein ACKVQQ_03300 [Burkholderiales bacterium]
MTKSWCAWVQASLNSLAAAPIEAMGFDELIVGTTFSGSQGTSGITANPAVGRAFDTKIDAGADCI